MKIINNCDPVTALRERDGGRTLRSLAVGAACLIFWIVAVWIASPLIA
jgi:hypothetical protein